MPRERVDLFKTNAAAGDISLSIHGPYYIALGSDDPEKVKNSLAELGKAVTLAKALGSKRVIFHLGSVYGDPRRALNQAARSLQQFVGENDLGEVTLYPETAGKVGQLGSFSDLLELCRLVPSTRPCLDMAHIYARRCSPLQSTRDFMSLFRAVGDALGPNALADLHIHMYPVETSDRGEKSHRAFSDLRDQLQLGLFSEEPAASHFLPRYEPLIEALVDERLAPTIICEAKDTQDVGALEMKAYYEKLVGRFPLA